MARDIIEMKKFIGTKINSYTLVRYISSGGYGDVYEVKKSNGKKFAIKIPNEKESSQASILLEYKIYRILSNREFGIPNTKITTIKTSVPFPTKGNKPLIGTKCMVVDLLGPSISRFLRKYRKFNLETTLLLSIQMLKTLKYIHSCGYLHRDLKLCNFTIDRSNPNKIFCIDFGLALKYTDNKGNHNPRVKCNAFYGTETYASIASHEHYTQSRRDDLESLFYTIVLMLRGGLPWQSLKIDEKKKRLKKIYEYKKNIIPEELCKGLPREFLIFFKYIKNLDYYDKPHYSTLIRMFENLYKQRGFTNKSMQWSLV